MKNRFGLFCGISLSVLVTLGAVSAQEKQPAPDRIMIEKVEHEGLVQGHPHPMPPGGDFVFFASEMSFDGKLVKGSPYSAEAITESTQTLSDGNRIVNKSTASIYRDSEGRTRREQSLRAFGPFANEGKPSQVIHISDPVAEVSYMLEPRSQVARKMPPMRFKFDFKTPPTQHLAPGCKGHVRMELHSEYGIQKKTETGVAMGGSVRTIQTLERNRWANKTSELRPMAQKLLTIPAGGSAMSGPSRLLASAGIRLSCRSCDDPTY